MIGYTNTTKIWCLWDPQTRETHSASSTETTSTCSSTTGRVFNASDVRFDEIKIAGKCLPTLPEMELLKSFLLEEDMEPDKEVHTSVHPSEESVTEQ